MSEGDTVSAEPVVEDQVGQEAASASFDIEEIKSQILSQAKNEVNAAVTGMVNRVQEKINKSLNERLKEQQEAISALIKESSVSSDKSRSDAVPDSQEQSDELRSGDAVNEIKKRMMQLEKANQALQETLARTEAERVEAQRRSDYQVALNSFVSQTKDLLENPKHFLSATSDVIYFDDELKDFVLEEKDNYGDVVKIPARERVKVILDKPDYSYMKKRRGRGVGLTPTDTGASASSASSAFASDSSSLLDAAKSGDTNYIMAELSKSRKAK